MEDRWLQRVQGIARIVRIAWVTFDDPNVVAGASQIRLCSMRQSG